MNDLLVLIKPKRLSNNLAYICKDKVILNFNNCLDVICYGDTNTGSSDSLIITHKDLYSQELDKASSISYDINIPSSLVYKNITIDSNTNSFFSSISMAGEDTYWTSYLFTIKDKFASTIWGLNYMAEYSQIGVYPSCDIKEACDYNVFYYLFQFTKHLTGKKTCNISIAKQGDYLYITNEDRSIILRQYLKDKKVIYKINSLTEINKLYSNNTDKSQQVSKKVAVEQYGSLFKNFSRVYNDILYTKDFEYNTFFYDDKFKLWIMKELKE